MIRSLLYLLLRRVLGLLRSDHRAAAEAEVEIAVLRHQVAVLRRQVKRPVYRASDKAFLAAASRILRREAWHSFLVRPETLLRWHRQLVARKWTKPHRRPGRPALDPGVRELVLRLGRENPRWGYTRIQGELLKLGVRVSATTIATVLRRYGLGPAPMRGPTWREFLGTVALVVEARDQQDSAHEISPIPSFAPDPALSFRRVPVPAGDHYPGRALYLRFDLSYRDVEELLAERGVEVDHVTIFRWVQRFAPEFAEAARARRHMVGDRWHVDETYLKVGGNWRYLFRAIDQFGQVIDVFLSLRRNRGAARRFFAQAISRTRVSPTEVATDRYRVYPRVLE